VAEAKTGRTVWAKAPDILEAVAKALSAGELAAELYMAVSDRPIAVRKGTALAVRNEVNVIARARYDPSAVAARLAQAHRRFDALSAGPGASAYPVGSVSSFSDGSEEEDDGSEVFRRGMRGALSSSSSRMGATDDDEEEDGEGEGDGEEEGEEEGEEGSAGHGHAASPAAATAYASAHDSDDDIVGATTSAAAAPPVPATPRRSRIPRAADAPAVSGSVAAARSRSLPTPSEVRAWSSDRLRAEARALVPAYNPRATTAIDTIRSEYLRRVQRALA